jgi:hypothetical protein
MDLVAPYLTIEPGTAGPQEWSVITGKTPPASAMTKTVTAHGEDSVDYAIDYESRHLYHLQPADEASVVQSLLRTTRAIHRSAAMGMGMVFVHGGLMRVDQLGVAVVGARRAGKTSLIMASVLNGLGRLVCNDGVGLAVEGTGSVYGVGWPGSVSVRLDTLDLLFGRTQSLEIQSGLKHPANKTLSRLHENGDEPHGNALLYLAEYSQILDSAIAHGSTVDVVVYPSLANPGDAARCAPVSPGNNRELFSKFVLSESNKHLNSFGDEPDKERAERAVDMIGALPAFRFCYQFPDVRRQADRLADFLMREVKTGV